MLDKIYAVIAPTFGKGLVTLHKGHTQNLINYRKGNRLAPLSGLSAIVTLTLLMLVSAQAGAETRTAKAQRLNMALAYAAPAGNKAANRWLDEAEQNYRPTRSYTIVEQTDGSLQAVETSAAQANQQWLDRHHNERKLGRQNASAVRKLLRKGARELYYGFKNGGSFSPDFSKEGSNRFAREDSDREYDLRINGDKVKISMEMLF